MRVRIRIKNAITDDTMDTAGIPNEIFPILKLVKTPLSHQRIYIDRKKGFRIMIPYMVVARSPSMKKKKPTAMR